MTIYLIFDSFISMSNLHTSSDQLIYVSNSEDFLTTPFKGDKNAICWNRELKGDFQEIVEKVHFEENMITLKEADLMEINLTKEGHLARETLLNDLRFFQELGTLPTLNIIKHYEIDDVFPYFPTDVYSFHVDRSDIPADTILCTYYGESSEIIPNAQAIQKIQIPDIREKLKAFHKGPDSEFDTFLKEQFFDLHYHVNPNSNPIKLGNGNLWRLAIDHPTQIVPPCIHRAPKENSGKRRLLLIC